jgi:cytochrome c oxidase subunit 4
VKGGELDLQKTKHSPVAVRTYAWIWIVLLMFTGVTVAVSRMHLGAWSVFAALVIASCKALLVLYFYMHLKYEKAMFQYMFLVAIMILFIFIGFTFFDVAYR